MSRFTFRFDASACSGCKSCQLACKDRHGLGPGVLWRRVYEVAGGGWRPRGPAWLSDVFAYHLSIGCNHCKEPICVEVCPAGAVRQREDGIVLLDSSKCVGCRYCAWACPYGAPQFDERAGRMTKCSFCAEDLAQGAAPTCVSACPMRALEWEVEAEPAGGPGCGEVSPPYPLPDPHLTKPSWVIVPHPAARRAAPGAARIGNAEEVGGT